MRKKSVEAIQFNGKNKEEIYDFLGLPRPYVSKKLRFPGTKYDMLIVHEGDWVIKDTKNGGHSGVYSCNPELFEQEYTVKKE
jgi:hypothetical protein